MPKQNKIVVLDLDDSNIGQFAKEMSSHGMVFIAFLADWCGHCQHFKPEWEKIKTHLKKHSEGSGHVVTSNEEKTKYSSSYYSNKHWQFILCWIGENLI